MSHDDDHATWLHARASVTIVELERTSGLDPTLFVPRDPRGSEDGQSSE